MRRIDTRKLYNDVDAQVQEMLTNWAKRNGIETPDAMGIDALSCSIAAVFGGAVERQQAGWEEKP